MTKARPSAVRLAARLRRQLEGEPGGEAIGDVLRHGKPHAGTLADRPVVICVA